MKWQLVAGHHVMLPSDSTPSRRGAYFLAEGELPREELERCAPRAFKTTGLEVHQAGELVAFRTSVGTVYAAWRGRFVLFGGERQVLAALRAQDRDTAARWRALTAQLPKDAIGWVVSVDQRPTNPMLALGTTTDIMFSFDQAQRTPQPRMTGSVRRALRLGRGGRPERRVDQTWSTRGEWPFPVPLPAEQGKIFNQMAKGIAALPLTQQGNQLEIVWDSDQLGGVDNLNEFFRTGTEELQTAP